LEQDNEHALPESSWIGANLDWNASWESVWLTVELPFWLMTPDSEFVVSVASHDYRIILDEHYCEVHVGQITDSGGSCAYQGPFPPAKNIGEQILAGGVSTLLRKCKTCVRISTRCNSDVIHAATGEDEKRRRTAQWYLISLCAAHVPVLNTLIRAYILQTYDPLVHEVSPWDVPRWLVRLQDNTGLPVTLMPSAAWDLKPHTFDWSERDDPRAQGQAFEYVNAEGLKEGLTLEPTPGELELAQAMHLRERGDYSGAVRRAVTSVEVLLEAQLRSELRKLYPDGEVEDRLRASRNDFPGRLRQYEKLSGRSSPLSEQFDEIREMRHVVVHRGHRIAFEDRGAANRAVDVSRFLFQWLENSESSTHRRERLLVQRQLGAHMSLFYSSLTPDGPIIDPPPR
jgi:hypothetical protein